MEALVINLKSSTDRRTFQASQLSKLGIPHSFIHACSVIDFSEKEYESLANNWERKLRKAEVACFLSHKKAWETVITRNKPLLILEDDALLSKHSKALLNTLSSKKALDHVIKMGRVESLKIRNFI